MGKSQEVKQSMSKSLSSKKVLGNDKPAPKMSIARGEGCGKKDEHHPRVKSAISAVSSNNGNGSVSGTTGSNMRKLLDDLHQSRIGIEQDQRAYEKARAEIKEVDKKIAKVKLELKKGEDKWNNLCKDVAEKKTELSTVEIRNKIVENSLKRGEQELASVSEELHKVRLESSQLASSFLSDSTNFAWLWNGTELGRGNRLQHDQVEMENLQREKSQLELELKDFLVLKKEGERAKVELEQEYKARDETVCDREKGLRERILELDAVLLDLHKQKNELVRSSEEECEKLRLQIQESMKQAGNKYKKNHSPIDSQVSLIDSCSSEELQSHSEGQGSINAAGAKHRPPNFQTPAVKSEPSNKAPTKVRAVERQTSITTFMKQYIPENSATRVKLNSSTSGKVFQFKKKPQSFTEKENVSTSSDSLNTSSSSTSVLDQCEPEPVRAVKRKSEPSNQLNYYTRFSGNDFYDKPYSSFNSSRILLSISQEEHL